MPFAYPDASWAVVKPAKILIFDNSASALDLKKAISLYGALQESYPDATKLIVTQRIASTRHADRIVMLKNGQIAAAGTRFTSQ